MRTPESLTALVDHGIIDEVVRPLMSGKEAHVYLVLSGGEQRVAKIYKEAQNRSFQNRADYTEGRKVRNSRDQRAMGRGTRHGKAQNEAAWKSAEVDMIYRLRDAGVRVPNPHHFIDGVLIMELVVDADGFPAPRLGDLVWEPADASALFKQMLGEVVRMLSIGVVHGDLSDFNVLMSATGPVVIDFPQSVDAATNANARKLLLRDVENLNRFAAKFDPTHIPLPYAEEMWELYKRNALTPETQLSGRFKGAQKVASTTAVLDLISDANKDERRRREARGLSMRGTSLDANEPTESAEAAGGVARAERPARDQEPRRGPAGREPRFRAPGGAPFSARAPEGPLGPHVEAPPRSRVEEPRASTQRARADAPPASTGARGPTRDDARGPTRDDARGPTPDRHDRAPGPREARAGAPERAARASGQDRYERGPAEGRETRAPGSDLRSRAEPRASTLRSHAEEPRASTLRSRAQEPRGSTLRSHAEEPRASTRELPVPAPSRDARAPLADRERAPSPSRDARGSVQDRDARAPSVRSRGEEPSASPRPAARNFDIRPPLGERVNRPHTQEREPHDQVARAGGQDRDLRTLREDRTARGPGVAQDAGPATPARDERSSRAHDRARDDRARDDRSRDARRVPEGDPRTVPEGQPRAGGHAVGRQAEGRVSSFGERVPYRGQHAESGQRVPGERGQGGTGPARNGRRGQEQASSDRSSDYPKRPR